MCAGAHLPSVPSNQSLIKLLSAQGEILFNFAKTRYDHEGKNIYHEVITFVETGEEGALRGFVTGNLMHQLLVVLDTRSSIAIYLHILNNKGIDNNSPPIEGRKIVIMAMRMQPKL